jgi:hypothetical protein
MRIMSVIKHLGKHNRCRSARVAIAAIVTCGVIVMPDFNLTNNLTNQIKFEQAAYALPGQTETQVADWIRANPALKPTRSERLLVRKSDTAARRFQFQASVLIPGIAKVPGDGNLIRSEEISFFDAVNGVTRDRLEESIRSIYGASIMRDYVSAKTIYAYPTEEMIARAKVNNGNILLIALQGELREGEQFAYWIETVENASGRANSGRVVVFERKDLPKLAAELRKREVTLP